MEFKEEHIALFDRYLNGEMNDDEQQSFEARLADNSSLQEELDAFKMFEQAIRDSEAVAFKSTLNAWDKEETTEEKSPKIRWIRLVTAAASIVLIVVLVNLFRGAPSNEALMSEYFVAYENVSVVRGEETQAAMQAYSEGDYASAVKELSPIKDNVSARFYLAESYMSLSRFQEAEEIYVELLQEETAFSEIARFHLSLALIGQDKHAEAKEVLMEIDANSTYKSQATSLLKLIE